MITRFLNWLRIKPKPTLEEKPVVYIPPVEEAPKPKTKPAVKKATTRAVVKKATTVAKKTTKKAK